MVQFIHMPCDYPDFGPRSTGYKKKKNTNSDLIETRFDADRKHSV